MNPAIATPSILTRMRSGDYLSDYACIATATALYRVLHRSHQVKEIRDALAIGELTDDDIRRFSTELLIDLKRGVKFKHEFVIAAFTVAIERRDTDFADEYLRDLASLELTEMAMSIRVARECLKNRETLGHRSPVAKLPAPCVP